MSDERSVEALLYEIGTLRGGSLVLYKPCVRSAGIPYRRDPPPPGSTAPVVDCAACVTGTCYRPIDHNGTCADGSAGLSKDPLVHARPAGASWCGAHDMAGNVFEWVESHEPAVCLGGSFRSHEVMDRSQGAAAPSDDVGFRAALSAT